MNNIPEVGFDRLLSLLKRNEQRYNIEKIQQSYDYAKSLHEGQFRISGEPYISHPVAVAEIVAGLGLDTDSICAALLHDTVEDCADKTDLASSFSSAIPAQASPTRSSPAKRLRSRFNEKIRHTTKRCVGFLFYFSCESRCFT